MVLQGLNSYSQRSKALVSTPATVLASSGSGGGTGRHGAICLGLLGDALLHLEATTAGVAHSCHAVRSLLSSTSPAKAQALASVQGTRQRANRDPALAMPSQASRLCGLLDLSPPQDTGNGPAQQPDPTPPASHRDSRRTEAIQPPPPRACHTPSAKTPALLQNAHPR